MLRRLINKFKNNLDPSNLQLLAHSKNFISANVVSQGLALLTVPLFTRLLTTEQYGIFSIYSTIVSIFSIIMLLSITVGISRYFYEEKKDFKELLSTNIIFWALLNIIFLIIFYIFRIPISKGFNIDTDIFYIAIVVSALSGAIRLYLSYLQYNRLSRKYSRFDIIKNISKIALSVVFVLVMIENKHLSKIYSQLIIVIIFSIYSLYKLIGHSKLNFKLNHILYTLKISLPIIPHSLSAIILTSFDRLIINDLNGASDAGLYSFAYTVGLIMGIVVSGINKSWVPMFYSNLNKNDFESINSLAKKTSKYVYFTAICLILASKEIAMVLADEKYHSAFSIIPIIILSYVCVYLYNIYTNYSFYRKKTILISINTIIAGFINIGLNYMFIPKYGYQAAAYTTLFSYFILFLLHYLNVKYIIKEKPMIPLMTVISPIILVFFGTGIFYLSDFFIDKYLISLLIKITYIAVSFFIYFVNKKIRFFNFFNSE